MVKTQVLLPAAGYGFAIKSGKIKAIAAQTKLRSKEIANGFN